jgi:hypothetical protein
MQTSNPALKRKLEAAMRDPHVTHLHYTVGAGPGLSYASPQPMAFANALGSFCIIDDQMVFEPAEHFAAEGEARAAVEPFLRAWEVEADLNRNLGTVRFRFQRGDVVDRDPPKPGENLVIEARGAGTIMLTGHATAHLTMNQYPDPPSSFRVTPEVEMAYRRWARFREGKEPLPAMAYFVLTTIEAAAGGRAQASATFSVELSVLRTLGQLTSEKGDAESARKVKAGKSLHALTGPEQQWIEQVVRRLILRLGEHASGAAVSAIRMTDLPAL